MNTTRQSVLILALTVLLATSGNLAVADQGVQTDGIPDEQSATGLTESGVTTATQSTAESVSAADEIQLTQRTARLTDRPGVYEARHEYRIPDQVGLLEVGLPDRATVTSQRGFVRRSDGTYEWDGSTATPTITYHVAANETTDRSGPIAGPGDYLFVDTGEWGLVRLPEVSHRWGWRGTSTVDLSTTTTVSGPGAASDTIAFLGEHERYTQTAHDQEFTLIVPQRAALSAPPDEIFASLSDASETLRVGDRDERVFAVAAPTGQVEWGVRGLQTGPADMWTRDTESLATADNVWLHEYVHTRQGYATTSDFQWFVEGSANYYAALLTLEQNRIDFEAFRSTLAIGTDSRLNDTVLSDPTTWRHGGNYYVGALVAGELDRQIRLASSGEQSLQSVFWRLNSEGFVSAATFQDAVRDAGGSSVADLSEGYTNGAERPAMWTAEQNGDAFDSVPAQISYGVDGGLRVTGPYRNRTLESTDELVFVPGERIGFDATVTNFGGTIGAYEAVFRVDGERHATHSGSLAPGASTTVAFEENVEQIGTSAWTVGNSDLAVSVREPARARVANIEADRATVAPGETVSFTVTVTNDATYPGERTVEIGENARTVRLDANETKTVTVERRFATAGTYTVSADGASETVTVRTATEEQSGRYDVPVLIGVLAILLLAGGALLSRR